MDQSLLTNMLNTSPSAHSMAESAIVSEAMVSMIEAARRRRDVAFSLDPIAIDMVHAMLIESFYVAAHEASGWRAIAIHVAKVLYDDSVAHERMKSLWERLLVTVP